MPCSCHGTQTCPRLGCFVPHKPSLPHRAPRCPARERKKNTVLNVFLLQARYQQSFPIIFIAASSFHYRCSHYSLVRTTLQVPAAALVRAGTIKTEWSIVVLVELYHRKSLSYLKNSRWTSSYTLTLTGRHISGSMQSPPGHFCGTSGANENQGQNIRYYTRFFTHPFLPC